MACTPAGARSRGRAGHYTMPDFIFSKHARLEAYEDGITESEIKEALSRGNRIRQNGKFITIYKYFTVVFKKSGDTYKIITVHAGNPRKWHNE